jgi:hypothetical protein
VLLRTEAARGEAKLAMAGQNDIALTFKDTGAGSSAITATVSFAGGDAIAVNSDGELLRASDFSTKAKGNTPQAIEQALDAAKAKSLEVAAKLNVKFETIRTTHFLIFTDWDPREYGFLKSNVEQAYDAVAGEFKSSAADSVFFGVLPIYMFARQGDFMTFAKEYDNFKEINRDVLGYFSPSMTGFGHMAMWKPRTNEDPKVTRYAEMEWARVLTHEFTHAFIARYRTILGIPRWLNEGCAEVVASGKFPYARSIYPFVRDRDRQHSKFVANILHDKGALVGDDYPTCQTLVETLQSKGGPTFLRFFNDIKDGGDPEAALQKHFKMNYNQLEDAWRDYVASKK